MGSILLSATQWGQAGTEPFPLYQKVFLWIHTDQRCFAGTKRLRSNAGQIIMYCQVKEWKAVLYHSLVMPEKWGRVWSLLFNC